VPTWTRLQVGRVQSTHAAAEASYAGLFDMALKNLGFLGFFKNLKNLKSPNLGFLENKNQCPI